MGFIVGWNTPLPGGGVAGTTYLTAMMGVRRRPAAALPQPLRKELVCDVAAACDADIAKKASQRCSKLRDYAADLDALHT